MRLVIWYRVVDDAVQGIGFDCPTHPGAGVEVVSDSGGTISIICAKYGCPLADFESRERMQAGLESAVEHGKPYIEPELRKLVKPRRVA
jgi:hypothetical protein